MLPPALLEASTRSPPSPLRERRRQKAGGALEKAPYVKGKANSAAFFLLSAPTTPQASVCYTYELRECAVL